MFSLQPYRSQFFDVAQVVLTGTPKLLENHLEGVFARSTAREWKVPCANCNRHVILDERCLGSEGTICPDCRTPIDVAQGQWVPRNPHATGGEGFWINHLMVPWVPYDEILGRQRDYDSAKFRNEVLGLPTSLGDHIVTRAEMEACCADYPMVSGPEEIVGGVELFAGIDWGGGIASRSVLVIGAMGADFVFHVLRIEHFAAGEEPNCVLDTIALRCQQFQVQWIAADGGGNGQVYNRLLVDRLRNGAKLFAVLYSQADQPPNREGAIFKWTVSRSGTIGALFSRVKKQMIVFPCVEQCGAYLDEFACEIAEYDDYHRTIKYTHPETQLDDVLHATNYALALAIRKFNAVRVLA